MFGWFLSVCFAILSCKLSIAHVLLWARVRYIAYTVCLHLICILTVFFVCEVGKCTQYGSKCHSLPLIIITLHCMWLLIVATCESKWCYAAFMLEVTEHTVCYSWLLCLWGVLNLASMCDALGVWCLWCVMPLVCDALGVYTVVPSVITGVLSVWCLSVWCLWYLSGVLIVDVLCMCVRLVSLVSVA